MIITDIKEWIKASYITISDYSKIMEYNPADLHLIYSCLRRNRIVCVDGFGMSVQGSYANYSTPKEYTNEYESMEVGFPTEDQPELDTFESVTGYVPIEDLQKIIDRHGGIDIIKSKLLDMNNEYSKKTKRILKLKRILE